MGSTLALNGSGVQMGRRRQEDGRQCCTLMSDFVDIDVGHAQAVPAAPTALVMPPTIPPDRYSSYSTTVPGAR
jgi:hypothetical protein